MIPRTYTPATVQAIQATGLGPPPHWKSYPDCELTYWIAMSSAGYPIPAAVVEDCLQELMMRREGVWVDQ